MMDDEFGHWLAGFIDGEGCFTIHRRSSQGTREGGQFSCRMTISLRADDGPILHEIQARTGLGRLEPWGGRGGQAPQMRCRVSSKRECLALVELLDRYPLRAKKARDYAIWREAVLEWASVGYQGRHARHDWTRMEEMKRRLEEGRRFAGVEHELSFESEGS